MRSIVIYYSYSGNTKKVAEFLNEHLTEKGPAEQLELNALDETKSFLGQCRRAVTHTRAAIASANFDLSGYDIICLGTPVWAFGPTPAMNTYLDKCLGLEGKSVILFTTFGSGTGNKRCLDYMQDILAKKGVSNCKRFSIQQFKVKDREFVLSRIKETTRL